jgi:predicted nucleic acid-binding protein
MTDIFDLLQGQRVYFDTVIFIHAVEPDKCEPRTRAAVAQLFQMVDAGGLHAVTSEMTLAETLVLPFRENDLALERAYRELLSSSGPFHVQPVDRDTLLAAAQLRADTSSLWTVDAIHVAAVRISECRFFVTNDKRFPVPRDLEKLVISQI